MIHHLKAQAQAALLWKDLFFSSWKDLVVVPVVALQAGMLVGIDAPNSKYCMGGCLTVEGTVRFCGSRISLTSVYFL